MPLETVEKLQTSLQTKAKAEPAFRFYALWDKVYRNDILREAYGRCRANAGAPGVDRETFEMIEAQGVEEWLETLREELKSGTYAPKPLLRVWISKSNGGQRPLGIPTIRDRVAQMAVVLIIGPIFEADLLPQQYGFRPKLDAKMARAVQRSLLSPICNSLEGLDAKGVADDSVGRKSLNLCEATESRRGRLEVPGNVSGAARHNP